MSDTGSRWRSAALAQATSAEWVYAALMRRWKIVTAGSVLIVALSIWWSDYTGRHPAPGSHSVDLTPLGPLVLGIAALLLLWIIAFISWYFQTLRKMRRGSQAPPDQFQ